MNPSAQASTKGILKSAMAIKAARSDSISDGSVHIARKDQP
jgi:hypothetical protein